MQACPRLSQQCFWFMEGDLPTENQLCIFWTSHEAAQLCREGCAHVRADVCMRACVCVYIYLTKFSSDLFLKIMQRTLFWSIQPILFLNGFIEM